MEPKKHQIYSFYQVYHLHQHSNCYTYLEKNLLPAFLTNFALYSVNITMLIVADAKYAFTMFIAFLSRFLNYTLSALPNHQCGMVS